MEKILSRILQAFSLRNKKTDRRTSTPEIEVEKQRQKEHAFWVAGCY